MVPDLGRVGYDVIHAWDVGNREVADEVYLRWAADRARVLFTCDIVYFKVLAERWAAEERNHAGIISSTQVRRDEYGRLLRRFIALLDQWAAGDLVNQVVWLPNLDAWPADHGSS